MDTIQARPAVTSSAPTRTWKVGTLTYSLRGLARLFGWLLWGDFAWSVRDRVIPTVMQLLFKQFGASDMVAGLLFASLPAALGLVVGPIVGYKSDRFRSPWGRRIPFLVATTPFLVIAMLGLSFCSQLGGYLHEALGRKSPGFASSALIVLGVCWTVFEISLITANSVFNALINDVVPSEVLGRFFGLFRVVSLVVGIIFFFWLMGACEAHFSLIFFLVAIIYGVGFSLMCLKVREGSYPPPPSTLGGVGDAFSAVRSYFKDGFGHPYYLWFFAATILGGMAAGPVNLYSVFYAKSLSMNMVTYGKCLAVTYGISLFISYPLGILVDRFHPLRVSMVVITLYGLAMAGSFYFVGGINEFAVALVIHGVIAGTYVTTSASLGLRLLPRAKFAEIGSAGGILGNLAGMAMAPALGCILDFTKHAYRNTFLAGFIFAAAALIVFVVLYGKFVALGGSKNYVAPE